MSDTKENGSRPPPKRSDGRPAKRSRHPLFGALAGLGKTAPGVDLTEPADPNWGERL